MSASGGVRLPWSGLPPEVRAGVETILGSPVIEAVSQPGGFSPGSADRVVLASGKRAFVKAVGAQPNPVSIAMHRKEALIAAALPSSVPSPAFLGSFDSGDWVALCFEDVSGRHPQTPWQADEVRATLAALAHLASVDVAPGRFPNPPAAESLAADFAGWERIAEEPPSALPPLAARHLDELRSLARQAPDACRGTALCHLDLRADNLLIDDRGRVLVVDWPWAAAGAGWLDSASLLVNVGLYGGHDLQALAAASPLLARTPAGDLDAYLSGLASFFVHEGRLPAPPGLPALRAFQRQQGDVVLAWLARRLGW